MTFSNFRMLAVKFSGTFGSGLIFSIVVFFGFIRTAPFVMVNGFSVDVRTFFSVMSASVFVTSNDPCKIGTLSISISGSTKSPFGFGFTVVDVGLAVGLLINVDGGPLRVFSSNMIDVGVVAYEK